MKLFNFLKRVGLSQKSPWYKKLAAVSFVAFFVLTGYFCIYPNAEKESNRPAIIRPLPNLLVNTSESLAQKIREKTGYGEELKSPGYFSRAYAFVMDHKSTIVYVVLTIIALLLAKHAYSAGWVSKSSVRATGLNLRENVQKVVQAQKTQ